MGNEQIEQLAQHNDNHRMTVLQMLTGQVIHSSSFTFFPFYYNIAYQLNRESSIHHMNQLEQFKICTLANQLWFMRRIWEEEEQHILLYKWLHNKNKLKVKYTLS